MTGVSTLGQALRQIENLGLQQTQFADLSTQLATGKKSQTYTGLGTDALRSVRARTSLTSIDVYINNITKADTRISLMLDSVEEFQAQTGEFSNTLTNFLQEGDHQLGDNVYYDDPLTTENDNIIVGKTSAQIDTDFTAMVNHATNLFDFLGDLLNAQEGDRYLLAGADSLNKPIEDKGTLDTTISNLLTEWKNGNITTDELIDDIFDGTALEGNSDAITDATVGFSSSLSSDNAGDVYVRADDNSEFKYTALANEDSFRDILVAMAVIKNENLPPIVDVYEDGNYPGTPDVKGAPGSTAEEQQDNFYQLYNALSDRVASSIDEIDQTRFRLETVRVQMNETQESHIQQQELLLTEVSNVEDVDVNEIAVRITTLQTQLQASYSVTAITQQLNLANYLR
ncbi:MAG: flagellin [Alcanivorax sp.]